MTKSLQPPFLLRSCTALLLFFCAGLCSAQTTEEKPAAEKAALKNYKNVIRFNLSNFLLLGPRNIILGYERVVSPSQSFSINLGSAGLPSLANFEFDSIDITKQTDKTGFNVSADYRFYLKKEN